MDGATVGLVSAICSTALGGLGLYFGNKARNQPFRERLYTKHLDLLMEAATLADTVHTACLGLLLAKDPEAEKRARDAAFAEGRRMQALLPRLSVLFPMEVWTSFVDFQEEAGRFLRDRPMRETRYKSLTDRYASLAGPMRKFAGADRLSDENAKQFGSRGDSEIRVGWFFSPK